MSTFDPEMLKTLAHTVWKEQRRNGLDWTGTVEATLKAFCKHAGIPAYALNALARGGATVMPYEATEAMLDAAHTALCNEGAVDPTEDDVRAVLRGLYAANPYA